MKTISITRKTSLSAVLIIITLTLASCTAPLPPVNINKEGVAIKGYDPVSYFDEGRPVKGREEYSFEWNGAHWFFSSEEHLESFRKNPEKFAPQYGGYCAYAVSRGSTADIDPEAWTIVNGKLYLNLNKKIQKVWSDKMSENIAKADRNWPGIVKELKN